MLLNSGGLEQGLEARAQAATRLKAIQEGHLVDQHRPQHQALGGDQALGRHGAGGVEDALELPVEVLDGVRAHLVAEAAPRDAGGALRGAARLGRDPGALACRTVLGQLAIVGTAAAIANAVYHATGIRVRGLPITPDNLVR